MTDIELRSLAPNYNEDDHLTYVSRLNAAVRDSQNKNIALTGRYGAGKSSILDQFIKDQERLATVPSSRWQRAWRKIRRSSYRPTKVLRFSINTLGPDKGEDLTNRIQKELVKQLLYRAKPGEVLSSEFARTPRLRWWQAGLHALVLAVALVGLLWLFGLRPLKDSLGSNDFWLPMAALFVLVLGTMWAIRWYIGNRVVAQVAAGGASIALEGKSESFFDRYLDELFAFFEATEPDIVIFEDLDRFDDPRIFDSLRELNTLVNSSAQWKDRQDRPLRFVYAIKDSLFEKLGDDQKEKDEAENQDNEDLTSDNPEPTPLRSAVEKKKDTAAAAVERANRTKFFEIVIPVVPFLSHSNARDHFLTELEKLKLPEGEDAEIDRGLIDIVARHTTDMRLMINIGNEFVVYAERLLWVDGTKRKRAPGLTADRLFALVVYKNFHLADFEALPHRDSALDELDKQRRILVDATITNLQRERASLMNGATRREQQRELAAKMSQRLAIILESTRMRLGSVTADSNTISIKETEDPSFWQTVARADTVEVLITSTDHGNSSVLDKARLDQMFPELVNIQKWIDVLSHDDWKRISEIDDEISLLRGIDFKALLNDGRYTSKGKTFSSLAQDALPSQLALDLVKRGYIDRYYAEYSTVFYGEFLGEDVAKFFRNSVWPNEMDTQFEFTTEGAEENVLEQAPDDFLHTRSALNIDIVNHLMTIEASSSGKLIDFLAQPNNAEAHRFLVSYLNTPRSLGETLVSQLAAKPWPELFSFIAIEGTIDGDDARVNLLNAALLGAPNFESFELDDDARALISRLHPKIPAFHKPQSGVPAKTLFDFLTDAEPSVPNLRALSPELQDLVVEAKRYALDADNIRAAAALSEESPISADTLTAKTVVWEYCVENIEDYLSLVENDERTTGSCASSHVLAQVVNAQHEEWSAEQMKAFLDASSESAALPDITETEQATWTTLADRKRVEPNFSNLESYATSIGVDEALAKLFTNGHEPTIVDIINVEHADVDQLQPLIAPLLNAKNVLEPRQRVLLAKQLWEASARPDLDLSVIEASPDDLLAELLREGMIDDTEEVFTHFSEAGWLSIGPALKVSTQAKTFVSPALIQGHASEIVQSNSFPEATRRALLERLVEFVPTEDQSFITSAATAARALQESLPEDALVSIAPDIRDYEDVVWQLKNQADSIQPNTVMQILGSMSGDFRGFSGSSGQKFEVSDTPSLGAVVERLKSADKVALQPGGRPKGRWKLRIT